MIEEIVLSSCGFFSPDFYLYLEKDKFIQNVLKIIAEKYRHTPFWYLIKLMAIEEWRFYMI